MNLASAVKKVDARGMLLVFPHENRAEPASLWREFHPRARMRWDWDQAADDRVVELWHLRARLATSQKVVYSKWYRGRATLIARPLFAAMLAAFRAQPGFDAVTHDARTLLDVLESDSPISSRVLRHRADLTGRSFEAAYQRALKSLFDRLAIVGFGEVDDGAFPSLAIGATRSLFEDLWDEAASLDVHEASRTIDVHLRAGTPFRSYFDRVLARLARATAPRRESAEHDADGWMLGVR